MKRSLIALLTLSLLLATACGQTSEGQTVSTDSGNTTDTTEEVSTELAPKTPDLNLDGRDFTIYEWRFHNEFDIFEQTGDLLEDAVYRRNIAIENKYNCKLGVVWSDGGPKDWSSWFGTLESSILAGDDSFQLVGGYSYRLMPLALNGNYLDWNTLPHIDLDMPWWQNTMDETASIGGATYTMKGSLATSHIDVTYAILFNKDLCRDYGVDDLYDLVDRGEWTFDKLREYSALCHADLNGDGNMTEVDRYGYLTGKNMYVDVWNDSFDIQFTRYENGKPVILPLSDKLKNVTDTLYDFFFDSGDAYYFMDDISLANEAFKNGQGMFVMSEIGQMAKLRDMESDFGIIPTPKYDAAQESYVTYNALGNSTGFVIPITADPEISAVISDQLAYEGWRDIVPVYYDIALKSKYGRDERSADMLDLIMSNIRCEFTQVYSYAFGDQEAPSMMLRQVIKKKSTDIASMYAERQTKWNNTLESLINTLS